MTIASASGNSTEVIVRESGPRGINGTAGTDGVGFNNVRKLLLDNPTLRLYVKNRFAEVLSSTVSVTRSTIGTYKDLQNIIKSEIVDGPRESKEGWLFEPARTNIVLQSQTFNTTWVQSNLTISADALAAPDETVTADQLIESAGSSIKDISQAVTVANTTEYTLSVFAKANSRNFIYLQDTANSSDGAYFNLATGAIGTIDAGITAKIEPLINGWYRCSIQSTSTTTSGGIKIQLADADQGGAYTGDASSGCYLWGAQLELSGFETSYIATVAASVLRGADINTFKALNNIPFLQDGFSVILRLGSYDEQSVSSDILIFPDATSGNVFRIGTSSGGKWEATIKGSDAVDYDATTAITAESTSSQTIIVTVSSIGVINIYIDGNVVNGTATVATALNGTIDSAGVATITGDFKTKIQELKILDYVLNSDEIDLLNS